MAAVLGFAALSSGRFSRTGAWGRVALAVGAVIALKLVEGALRDPILEHPALWPAHYAPAAAGLALAGLLLARADGPRAMGAPA